MIIAGRTQMMDAYPVPEALERMKELGFGGAEICVEDVDFGIRSDKRGDRGEEWRSLVARTRCLVEAAEANGTRLALEAEPGFTCGTSAELRRLIDEIGSPALGCNMDIGHAFLCDPDPIAAIHDLGDRIFHAHVENMRRGVHDHRLPSDGDMDLASFLAALTEIGFEGVAALDLYGYDYEAVAGEAIRDVEGLLREARGA